MPAPANQPLLVLLLNPVIDVPVVRSATVKPLLPTHPPPALPYNRTLLKATPNRAARVPIHLLFEVIWMRPPVPTAGTTTEALLWLFAAQSPGASEHCGRVCPGDGRARRGREGGDERRIGNRVRP